MKNNINVKNLNSLENFPKNAILIAYNDHYRYNSGDEIILTDENGQINEELQGVYLTHFNDNMYDRGVISLKALTHQNGAFPLFLEFKKICEQYVNASNDLKDWYAGKMVYNVKVDKKYDQFGNISTSLDKSKFEDSVWYKRVSKRCKPETIERKRKEFYEYQNELNSYIESVLVNEKTEKTKWFIENGISVRVAYVFLKGYIR